METRLLSSVSEIDPTEWNSIVGRDRLICRHEFLLAVEQSKINDCRFFYPVVYEHGQIVAHTCLYSISTELDSFAKGFLKKAITRVRGLWKDFLVLRSVECGTPVALGSTLSYKPGTDKKTSLLCVIRATEAIAAEIGVKVILFRDFYDSDLPLYDSLQNAGYRRIRNLPGTRIDIRWESYDAYLNSLRSRYRRKMLAQIRKFQKGNTSLELVRDFSAYTEDLARLWRHAYDHAKEYKREVLLRDFFESINRHLGSRSAILLAKLDGRPVGFSLLLFDDETLVPLFCGLDYTCSDDYGIYFNLLYHVVKTGIEHGMKHVDFGITTISPKLDLGAVVVPLHMYMKHLNPVLRRALPALFVAMTPQSSLSSRDVFNDR